MLPMHSISFAIAMFRVFNSSHPAIQLIPVDLGEVSIRVPVAPLKGNSEGPTLLITAGNDGDEYAGIAAAYRLIEEFSSFTCII